MMFIRSIFFCLISLCSAGASCATDEARSIYQQIQNHIYQIRVIDLASGNKASIGSGFAISDQGHIATNYHVVADFIQNQNRYRVEYLDSTGAIGQMKVLDVDVVHDLAIAKRDLPKSVKSGYLQLADEHLQKGTKIFSMGNPHDLGMTIIEGTFNGHLEKSLYEKILFSGSLNPGMSGGPSIDREGNVIGVNVSTAGNQISFLVPVYYLSRLKDAVLANQSKPNGNFDRRIEEQLLANQNEYMSRILHGPWKSITLGPAKVAGEITDVFKCWGDTDTDDENRYKLTYSQCSTDDRIYLSSDFSTGSIVYRYDWLTTEELNRFQFYNLYEQFHQGSQKFNAAQREDVSEFNCHTDFLSLSEKPWKATLCARQYKKYPGLFDVLLSFASLTENKRGLRSSAALRGVSEQQGMAFVRKFMESVSWQN